MDYGLLLPCLRFIHAVTCINAKLGSDGRLTLSDWLLNQLDYPGFAWRTVYLSTFPTATEQIPKCDKLLQVTAESLYSGRILT
jgi:hypothetical protein